METVGDGRWFQQTEDTVGWWPNWASYWRSKKDGIHGPARYVCYQRRVWRLQIAYQGQHTWENQVKCEETQRGRENGHERVDSRNEEALGKPETMFCVAAANTQRQRAAPRHNARPPSSLIFSRGARDGNFLGQSS